MSLTNQGCKGCQNASPFCLTTLQKVEFALLFQKPIQDPSIENRHTVPFPAAKALVGMTGFGPQSSVLQKQNSVSQKTGIGGPGVLWHIKIRYLPNAVSQSLRIQLALNSLANQNAGFIGGKTFQGENRQTIPRIRLRRILEFWHKAVAQEMAFSMPKRLSLLFDYFAKSRVCLAFLKANTRSLHSPTARSG